MAKKDLTQSMAHGLASLTRNPNQAEPTEVEQQAPSIVQDDEEPEPAATDSRKAVISTSYGLRTGFVRSTIIAKQETIAKMREIAYKERAYAMDLFEDALANYVAAYEAEHGKVRVPKPKTKKK